jgi:endonuclease/exonuclease/phosphatase family metal-dependent hydrolase
VLPLSIPLFFAVIFWRRRLVWVNAGLMVLAVLVLMPPRISAPRPRMERDTTVRIATWNVHEEFDEGEALSRALARQQPQIVCLQEARRDVFATLLPGAESAHTREVTTLTTGQIVSQQPVRLGPFPNYRWALETRLRLPQGTVTVLNVHFLTAFSGRTVRRNRHDLEAFLRRMDEARHLEAQAVREWLQSTSGARLIAGDFNSPPGTDVYREVAAVATDAFSVCGRGWGYTYRRDHPMIRIDHVFCSPEVRPLRVRAVNGHVSDHRMLVADIALTK